VDRPNDAEVPVIERRNPGLTEPLRQRDDARIDDADLEIPVGRVGRA